MRHIARAFEAGAHEDAPAAGLTVERRLGGAGMHITPAERREIALAYLSDPDLGTISACAKHFGRTREAVAGCLKGEAFDELRQQVDHEAGEAAKGILKRARVKAATAWVDKAIDAAAARGDHKPARDLLIVTKVIEPLPTTGGVYIAVVVNNKRIGWQSQINGVLYDELPDDADVGVQIGGFLEDDFRIQVEPKWIPVDGKDRQTVEMPAIETPVAVLDGDVKGSTD